MDSLPPEILSYVCQQLQRWTLSDHPFAHLTETSIYNTDGWLTHTTDSCRDVCNFRLSCQKMYHSSFSTFGQLLGSRIFRITKIGLEDLLSISRLQPLQPYIRTLTFGNACFGDISNSLLEEMLELMSPCDRRRLKLAYYDASRWGSADNRDLHIEMLTSALERLSYVRQVRFLISDHPSMHRHLGGWLGPGDAEVVAKALLDMSDNWLFDDCLYQLIIGDAGLFEPVLVALQKSCSTIEDLRIGHGYAAPPVYLPSIIGATGTAHPLRSFRLELDPRYLCYESTTIHMSIPRINDYGEVFDMLSNVTSLSLSMTRDAAFMDFALATTNLFELLKSVKELRQLTIRGVWTYTEGDLVNFAASRKNHLTQFALMGPVLLDKCWSSTLLAFMSHLTSVTKHIQLTSMSKRESNTRIIPALDKVRWQAFLRDVKPVTDNATYSICLSSDHRRYIHVPGI